MKHLPNVFVVALLLLITVQIFNLRGALPKTASVNTIFIHERLILEPVYAMESTLVEPPIITAVPIGEIDVWSDEGNRYRLVDRVVLEKVFLRGAPPATNIYAVNGRLFELVESLDMKAMHVTLFNDGGMNLTHRGETISAIPLELLLRRTTENTIPPSEEFRSSKGPEI